MSTVFWNQAGDQRFYALLGAVDTDITTRLEGITDTLNLNNQSADIGTTNFTPTTAGLYEVVYYLETTTADGAAGTVTVTFGFTDDAGATTVASSALSLAALGRTSGVIPIRFASGHITYSISHTGAYGTAKYALYAVLKYLN